MNFVHSLRCELMERAQQYAVTHGTSYCLSYGQTPAICFDSVDAVTGHGNFLSSTYQRILKNASWRRRLHKVHSQGRKSFPRNERGIWRELDACTSSDALLMNVFCYPGVFRDGRVCSMLDVKAHAIPTFGFRARVPLANGKFDRTEVDMRLGDLLIEAKLTEGDFQKAPKATVRAYRDFSEVFDGEGLPQTERDILSYQLIRNVLAAHASDCSFCVLTDARRPELIESWYAVVKCVRPVDLRMRCKVLTWQELASVTTRGLRDFLSEKYGIDSSGKVVTHFRVSDAETEGKVEGASLKGWGKIAQFLGQSSAVAQRWQKSGMPVTREGRFVYATPEELTNWIGTERGKSEPVHIASEGEDLVADLKQGLSYVRQQQKKRQP